MQNIPVSVDFSKTPIAFPHFFNAFGYANCDYTYTRPTQKLYRHLASIGRDFYYMRLHNILTAHGDGDLYLLTQGRDYGNPDPDAGRWADKVFSFQDGKLCCNWKYVDQIYDIILASGGKPIVETHFIPSCIQSSAYYIPKDFNLWADILKAFVSHCIERYGREEVQSWYFEVWNEPDNHEIWLKDASTFMALYDYFEDAIHSVDEKIKVGGPAVKQWEGAEKIYREFLEHCARGLNYKTGRFGTRVDFISVHCKAGEPQDTNPNTDIMFDWLKRYSEPLNDYPELGQVEFINDESDIVWHGNLGTWVKSWLNFRNTHYAAGITCKMMSRYCDLVLDDWKVNLSIVDSDNCHTQWERFLFSGNRSQVTPLTRYGTDDLIKKPLFNAYVLMNRLGDLRYKAECDTEGFKTKFGILPTSHQNSYAIMLWNFEDGMDDDINPRCFSLKLDGLKDGNYHLSHYRIDKTHSSSYHIWQKFGKPEKMIANQVKEIRAHEGLEPFESVKPLSISGGCVDLSLELPMHAVSLLLLTPVDNTVPAVPTSLYGVRENGFAGNCQVFLQWKPNREFDLKRYLIWRKEEGGDFVLVSDSATNNVSAFTDMTAKPGRRYSYAVEAETISGIRSGLSAPLVVE